MHSKPAGLIHFFEKNRGANKHGHSLFHAEIEHLLVMLKPLQFDIVVGEIDRIALVLQVDAETSCTISLNVYFFRNIVCCICRSFSPSLPTYSNMQQVLLQFHISDASIISSNSSSEWF